MLQPVPSPDKEGGSGNGLTTYSCKETIVVKPKELPRNNGRIFRRRLKLRNMEHAFGTWNVRTLNKPGAQTGLLSELKRYKIMVTAIQETKWLGKDIRDTKTHTILHSGKERGNKEYGVAFIVDNEFKSNITDFQAINERICRLRIHTRFFNLTMINVHCPTEEQETEIKENFYQQLEVAYDSSPKNDIKIIIGDMNAKIGKEQHFLGTIGRHSLHRETNENGEFLINFASSKNMIVSSTCFPHKDIHKMTWISPDGITANQIDHVLIDKRAASSISDVKTRRGACCGSDHLLVQAKFKCRVNKKKNEQQQQTNKFDIDKLKTLEIRERYDQEIMRKMAESETPSIEDQWNNIKTTVTNAATTIIGNKKRKNRATWFDEECKQVTEERNEAHKRYVARRTRERRTDFETARRKADKICRNKKRKYENRLIEIMEEDFKDNEVRGAYEYLKKLRKGYKPQTSLCKNERGQIISQQQGVKDNWKQHFQTLLGTRREAEDEFDITQLEEGETEIDSPTLEEVTEAIKAQKNNKAPGVDEIPAELYKLGGNHLTKCIHELITNIWKEEKLPNDWKKGIVCPIYKKGDKLLCKNYRGISLLCTAYKILTYIINQRLQPLTENIIGEYQTGFRRGRSTTDQIFTVRQILSKAWEHDIDVHNIFVDFKQAYDSINRNRLYQILFELEIPPKLIRLVKATMDDTEATIRIQNQLTDYFGISQGLKQGDGLAPTLFNLALEYAIRQMDVGRENLLINKTVQLAAYADDINIMSRTVIGAQEAYTQLKGHTKDIGLEINIEKTKILTQTRSNRVAQNINIEDNVETVEHFTYLGVELCKDGSEEAEIQKRITHANRAYFALSHVFRSRNVHRNTKLRVYKTIIRPIISYGSEAWALKETSINKLNIFERKVLRRILGPVKDNEIWRVRYNFEIYQLFKEVPLSEFIRIQRLQWAGHVIRMGEDRLPRRVLDRRMHGKRPVGKPRKRWEDAVTNDARDILGTRSWRRAALDKQGWRQKLKEAKAQFGL